VVNENSNLAFEGKQRDDFSKQVSNLEAPKLLLVAALEPLIETMSDQSLTQTFFPINRNP
jgi:hypothetical protein